ncbi:hypothetical protein BJF92_03100 [Rhizobium rhizosphaerae]|uniref:Glycoside hydrolase family 19 catalytic domain-containing protein n=1 Tax=Xaviernesmea rhizosphaerae TaxID=1672749 RepID=A0A1Q9ACI4_9HYPH|nr:glycoside hydrolase family 19 protein [Xaviernesmea rhizosphaerae]OLP52587.1 hypothetical protein BJF92_03100 [Xaviernesmea rhizosphaerae]
MTINRTFFFEELHETLFPNGLHESQYQGTARILDYWAQRHPALDDRFLAYILATAYHETGAAMQPVRETHATSDDQAIERLQRAFDNGQLTWVRKPYWNKDSEGKSWFGRGLVQLTRRDNYDRVGHNLGIDLTTDPSAALDDDNAIRIIVEGMIGGWFSGPKLADFFHGNVANWLRARAIINGSESAQKVARYGKSFYRALSYTV